MTLLAVRESAGRLHLVAPDGRPVCGHEPRRWWPHSQRAWNLLGGLRCAECERVARMMVGVGGGR